MAVTDRPQKRWLFHRKTQQQCCTLPGELARHIRVVTARKERQGRQQAARTAWQRRVASHQLLDLPAASRTNPAAL